MARTAKTVGLREHAGDHARTEPLAAGMWQRLARQQAGEGPGEHASRVVLPAPFGPTIAAVAPSGILKEGRVVEQVAMARVRG